MKSNVYEGDVLVFLYNNVDALPKFAEHLDPEHFSNEVFGALYNIMGAHWITHGERPTQNSIESAIRDDFQSPSPSFYEEDIPTLSKIMTHMFNNTYVADKWLDEDLTQWLRNSQYKVLTEKINYAMHEGRPDLIENYWSEAQQRLLQQDSSEGLDFFSSVGDLLDSYKKWAEARVIRTMYPTVNTILGGGLFKGEFGLLWGSAGVGKSFMLNNFGYAGVIDKKRVLHVTNEMSENLTGYRYLTMWSDTPTFDWLAPEKREQIMRVQKEAEGNRKGNLIIKYMPSGATPQSVSHLLEKAQREGNPFDMVLIDYIDNFELPGIDQDWLKIEKIMQAFCDMAKEEQYNVSIVAITHADAGAKGKRVASNKHFVRAKTGKDKVIDFSVFIGQNSKDDLETKTVICTVTKMRNREIKQQSCALRQNFGVGKFIEVPLPEDLE